MGQAQPEEQEQRREVLDRHRDADLEPVDREEVGGVDTGEPDHAEQRERRQLSAVDGHEVAAGHGEEERKDQPRPGGAELGEPRRVDAVVEQLTRHHAVERPHGRARRRQGVAAGGTAARHRSSRSKAKRPARSR